MPVHLVAHPVAHDALMALRDRTTTSDRFRALAYRVALVLAVEATRDLPVAPAEVETPLEVAHGHVVAADVVAVPVLRAGLGMLAAVLELLPRARVGHIGLQRDERTAEAATYFSKLPPGLGASTILMVDPMLATGGSAVAAIDLVKRAGGTDIRLLCIVAAPEGIAAVEAAHPGIHVYTPVVDRQLDERKFILPGLGDFGDRLYGTT